jgi:hypothetical protein
LAEPAGGHISILGGGRGNSPGSRQVARAAQDLVRWAHCAYATGHAVLQDKLPNTFDYTLLKKCVANN